MLIDLPSSILSISYTTIIIVAVLTGIFFFGVLSYAIKAQLSRITTGREGLIGEEGIAQTDVFHNGKVFIHGEIWNGKSDEQIPKRREGYCDRGRWPYHNSEEKRGIKSCTFHICFL